MGVCNRSPRAAVLSVGALWAVILIAAMLVCIKPARSASLETYGRLPSLEDIALSPDGSKLAFVHTRENDRVLAVLQLSPHKLLGGAKIGQVKLRELQWADNDHLLITTSTTGMPWGLRGTDTEWTQLAVYDIKTLKLKIYPDNEVSSDLRIMNVVAGPVMIRHLGNDTVLFIPGIYVLDQTNLALFKVNLTTHHQSVARLGSDATRGWLVDEAGEIVTEENYYERDQRWQMRIRRGGHWFDADSTRSPIDVPQMLGFGPKGDSVLVSTYDKGEPVWELLSLQDGKLGPPMEDGDDLNLPFEDPATHRMIGGIHFEDQSKYVFFNPELRSRWHSVVDAFTDERVDLVSTSADMMQFVVRVDSPAKGYRYELIDMNTARAWPVGDVYEGLTESFETRRITYEAADGLKIPAYLTLPAKRPAAKLPLVVLPHGGPAARDTLNFDWWAQAIASQGYAVLKPNYRGSVTTHSFMTAGYGEWGRKMQTDLSDGVRYLAKEGIIDPARVCIVGASYGGYAALAGVTLDPGIYRCAVSVAGISDLKRFMQWVNERDRVGNHIAGRYWDRYMGVQGPSDPALDAISPIKHIDKVNVPVLLVHGKDDTIVPYEQSEVMLKALTKANKKVELVTMKKEDHWLSRGETRLLMLQSSVAFLKANNPPD
ncbi:MAG: alpha/beta hydrolase family protein [Steroidobacteraceae bacterium]